MPGTILTREIYDKLLEAFRRQPGDLPAAKRYSGLDWRIVKRAWQGPPWKWAPWAMPIRDVIAAEEKRRLTRESDTDIQRRDAAFEAAEQARKIQEEAKDLDTKALRIMRKNLLGANIVFTKVLDGVVKLAERVNHQLELGVDAEGRPLDIDVMAGLRIMRQFASAVHGLTDATATLVSIERLQENLPTAILGLDLAGITLEQAETQVALANEALERAKELGLVVHQGGQLAETG